jgi:ArsR family metal-binding transcriptional regulator
MGRWITTFGCVSEFRKARSLLASRSLPCEVISPEPAFARVGAPSLVVDALGRSVLTGQGTQGSICAGWVEYRPSQIEVPPDAPPAFDEDVFGEAAVVVLAACVADGTKIRLIAHLSGDLSEVFGYLNAEMHEAHYNPAGPTFSFMERHRMVSMYARRIAIAKADDLVDGWRLLEQIRRRVNATWARRDRIVPSDEIREKPPALEIYKRLPGTNCRQCGQQTCLAFAVDLWLGGAAPSQCGPVFSGGDENRKQALMEICAGLGVLDGV